MGELGECPFVRLHGDDHVAIAKGTVEKQTEFRLSPDSESICTTDRMDLGHKVALSAIPQGGPVRKFGQLIGFATADIQPGDWVHSHNLAVGELNLDYAFASDVPADPEPIDGRTFMGYRRNDGRAATRNYIGLISTVNCSATTSKYVAQHFDASILDAFPNIDGVVPLAHKPQTSRTDRPTSVRPDLRRSRTIAPPAAHRRGRAGRYGSR